MNRNEPDQVGDRMASRALDRSGLNWNGPDRSGWDRMEPRRLARPRARGRRTLYILSSMTLTAASEVIGERWGMEGGGVLFFIRIRIASFPPWRPTEPGARLPPRFYLSSFLILFLFIFCYIFNFLLYFLFICIFIFKLFLAPRRRTDVSGFFFFF